MIDAREYVAYVTFFRCCPRVSDHVQANVKQIIEGKAAPKALMKQSDAVATKGTKAKIAPAGMAMCQGSAIQGFRSGQTKEIAASPLPHSFIPAIFLRTMRVLLSSGRWCRQSRWRIAREALRSLVAAPSAGRRTVWLVTSFR